MNWFEELCRNVGLMVHNVKHPEPRPPQANQTHVVNRTVQEQQISPTTTLRRTTIEEIEIKHPPQP
jgi:hypothetical protein